MSSKKISLISICWLINCYTIQIAKFFNGYLKINHVRFLKKINFIFNVECAFIVLKK